MSILGSIVDYYFPSNLSYTLLQTFHLVLYFILIKNEIILLQVQLRKVKKNFF